MGIKVVTIDENAIEDKLRKAGDKETLNYIKCLKEALKRQQELTALAISKLRKDA